MNEEGAYTDTEVRQKTQERWTFLIFLSDALLLMQHCLSDCLLHKLFQSWSNQIMPKTRLIYAFEV